MNGRRPLILVTNDDGIEVDGLWFLAQEMLAHGEVLVVAPAFNQSGMSGAFTLRGELESERAYSRLDKVDAFQVSGTPTDAVVHGLRRYAPRHVSMIVSGVNPGPNMGREVLHSGTVMAALQGYLRGLPSVAVSLASFEEQHWHDAARIGAAVAGRLLASGEPRFLNVNVPDLVIDEIKGVEVTQLANETITRLVETHDDHGATRRRLQPRLDVVLQPGTDIHAVLGGSVSITPLHNDLTNHTALAATSDLIDGADLLG